MIELSGACVIFLFVINLVCFNFSIAYTIYIYTTCYCSIAVKCHHLKIQ